MFCEIPGFSNGFISRDAEPVLEVLQEILMGQQLICVNDAPSDQSLVQISREQNDAWRVTPVGPEPAISFTDPVSAACCLGASLLKARMLEEQEVLCLHAAAVEIGGALVLMPNVYRAGKSLLSVALAAGGCRLFNDDVVLLDPHSKDAIAPGIAPRLRLPLPTNLDPLSRSFIAEHGGPRGTHYLYLTPTTDLHAAPGERAAIHGFIMLNRQERGSAKLSEIGSGDVLRQLIWQNFARAGLAERILSSLSDIISSSQCLALSYSNIEDARQVLIEHFSGSDLSGGECTRVSIAGDDSFEGKSGMAEEIAEESIVAGVQGAALKECFGERFLINADNDRILHLNETAAALWNLLAEPLPFGDVVETFSAAFPTVERQQLKHDLETIVAVMRMNGLVRL